MALFFRPMAVFVEYPFVAFVLAGAFIGLFLYSLVQWKRGVHVNPWPLLLLAGVWGLYGLYERAMFAWSQTVTTPIRIDLLLIVPVLYVSTIGGSIAWVTSWRREPTVRRSPAVTAVAWLIVLWSGVGVLWNLIEFHIRMDTYRVTPAGELSYWLRATGVTMGAIAFSVAYLITSMRILRHSHHAVALMCWLVIASILWTLLKAAFKLVGLGMLAVPWLGVWGSAMVPLAWYGVLLWFFTRSSIRAYDAGGDVGR